MSSLLARLAENAFWLARHMERTESLARFLDVNESYVRGQTGESQWLPMLQLHVYEARFRESHPNVTAASVIHFYVLDQENPGSIVSMVGAARENARSLRHLISTEMWSQFNVFHGRVRALNRRDISLQNLSRTCAFIKEGCQSHFGIGEGTLYRDQAWCFYTLGKYLERADLTSRLLDVQYHQILGWTEGAEEGDVNVSQWNALLRFVAGYQAFRRIHPRGMDPQQVAAFLIFDWAFPRSIAACLGEVRDTLDLLQKTHGLACPPPARRSLARLRRRFATGSMASVRREGLHRFSDRLQRSLILLTDDLHRSFFARDVPVATETS